ncbi:MAG: thioredoxin family protein [Bacillota bacterium]|jgi:thioredoxin-like negative regulator of GroEL
MKKMFFTIFLVGICLSVAIYFWQTRPSQSLQAPEITPEQLIQRMEQGEDFYVYFYSPTCTECIQSEPNLAQAVKATSVDIVKIDLKKYEYVKEQLDVPGTPSIFYYQDGKLVKGITGALETVEEYEQFFQDTGGTK